MTAQQHLIPLQDRTIAGSVWKVIICPQMELVAVVLDRNSVAIYRTDWHRLTTISVCSAQNELITSIAWSPDGANLVVGTSSKSLAVYSVDRCASTPSLRAKRASRETEPVVTRQLPAVPTAILWSPAPSLSLDKPKLNTSKAYENRAEKIHDFKPKAINEAYKGLLFVGDTDGKMTILSHNLLLSVASVNAVPDGFTVRDIQLSASQRYCFTGGSSHPFEDKDVQEGTSETCVVFRAFDLSAVLEHWLELSRLGLEVLKFNDVIQRLLKAVKDVRERWVEGGLEALRSTIQKPLDELITRFAEENSDAWQTLHDIYCGARIKGAALQFLAHDLSENGAKEALRSFQNHADDTEDIVLSMVPVAQDTVFSSSEYRGLARLEHRFKPIGIEVAGADELFGTSEQLLLAVGDLVAEIEEVSSETEAFLAWLVTAAAQAGGESANPRGPTWSDRMSKQDAEMVSKFFVKHSSRVEPGNETTYKSSGTLLIDEVEKRLETFTKAVEDVVKKPCDVISNNVELRDELILRRGLEFYIPTSLSGLKRGSNEKNDSHHFCIISYAGNGCFTVVKFLTTKGKWIAQKCKLPTIEGQLEAAGMSSDNTLVAVTSATQCTTEDERAECSISLHELDTRQSIMDTMTDDLDFPAADVTAGSDAVILSGSQLDSKPCGHFKKNSDIKLAVNEKHGLVCLLVAPRKIFLFQTPNRSVHQDQHVQAGQ